MASVIELHPVVEAAGRRNEPPEWAELTEPRLDHVRRVSELLADWSEALELPEQERVRWRAAGLLHDALKDAPIGRLRELVGDEGWPDPVLHAPAAAARLGRDGVDDEALLLAVAYHPVGHPSFDELGVHLYLADYLEPGRPDAGHRAALRKLMPAGRREVLPQVIRRRIEVQLAGGHVILPAAIGFWNRVVEE